MVMFLFFKPLYLKKKTTTQNKQTKNNFVIRNAFIFKYFFSKLCHMMLIYQFALKKNTHTPYETDPVVSFYLDIYFLISQKAFRENCAAYLSCLLT